MKILVIRTSAMLCRRQSQSIGMLLPFFGARLSSGARLVFPASPAVISPTRFAWRFLSRKCPPGKYARMGCFRHVMPKITYTTFWGICRGIGKTSLETEMELACKLQE
jgi:hypothetical protein